MKDYIVYGADKFIRRTGVCKNRSFSAQSRDPGTFVLEGVANDLTDKVEFDSLDSKGQPINPRVMRKTQAEIDAGNAGRTDPLDLPMSITPRQWQALDKRVRDLEKPQ